MSIFAIAMLYGNYHFDQNVNMWSVNFILCIKSYASYQLECVWFYSEYIILNAAAAKSLQLCPPLCNPIDGSPPGSPVPGILQARTLEWVAISFSNAGKWKVKVKSLSRVWLLATPWTAADQAPPSMGFFQARILEWGAIAFSDDPTCRVAKVTQM